MKIAIASLGRFRLDLARMLIDLGHDVSFFSYAPETRLNRFGLAKENHVALLSRLFPALAWQHKLSWLRPDLNEKFKCWSLDRAVMGLLQPCDVFVCMSGAYLEAAKFARERYGAKIVVERGSQHILAQRNTLIANGVKRIPSDYIIGRELQLYELADRIVVPSSFAQGSFIAEAPHLQAKVFSTPFGVDIDSFPQKPRRKKNEPRTVIFVGGWMERKGVDVLVDAIRQLDGVKLMHLGKIVDSDFPLNDERFQHIGHVPQWELAKYYAKADVFTLPSREDGFGAVITQALACGLPVVCSKNTGAPDLLYNDEFRMRIALVEPNDPVELASSLRAMLDKDVPPLSAEGRQLLSWSAYGHRYDEIIAGLA